MGRKQRPPKHGLRARMNGDRPPGSGKARRQEEEQPYVDWDEEQPKSRRVPTKKRQPSCGVCAVFADGLRKTRADLAAAREKVARLGESSRVGAEQLCAEAAKVAGLEAQLAEAREEIAEWEQTGESNEYRAMKVEIATLAERVRDIEAAIRQVYNSEDCYSDDCECDGCAMIRRVLVDVVPVGETSNGTDAGEEEKDDE